MYLIIKNHSFIYNVQSVVQIFFQNEKFINVETVQQEGYTVKSEMNDDNIETTLYIDGNKILKLNKKVDTDISHLVKVSVFLLLKEHFDYHPSYGLMTGIRPTKLVQKFHSEGLSNEEIRKILKDKYFVLDEKIDFLIEVSQNEMKVLKQIDVKNNALYIGIPFCPSICAYCSFTSFNMKKYKDNGLMTEYVNLLINELEYVVENTKGQFENVYIGGGTPTSLDNDNFTRLLLKVNELIEVEKLKEFTVEAGRVDTITKSKLEIMKKLNVSRISINAQSMSDETLRLNGRTHTSKQFIDVYNMAREIGFDYINVDMIVGLLGDTEKDIINTVEEIIKIKPENITIHTLAIKKGSQYKLKLEQFSFIDNKNLKQVLEELYTRLYKNEYLPYYMYRQKNILGNFENTGFSLKNKESIYNVSIVLEVQSIIGLGCGSASKKILDSDVKRTYNLSGVEEYINNFDIILERKQMFFE